MSPDITNLSGSGARESALSGAEALELETWGGN